MFYFKFVVYFDYEVIVEVVVCIVGCMYELDWFCFIFVVFSNDVLEIFGEFDI